MYTPLSSYALEGIEVVPVEVALEGNQGMVVEPETRRRLDSIRLESTESVSSVIEHVVNAHTHPDRNLAPARLQSEKSPYHSHPPYNTQTVR